MTDENLIELHVEIPGREHACYDHYDDYGRTGGLRLTKVVYPLEHYPADLCVVTDSLGDDGAPLGALLLGNVSHPAGCLVGARPIGTLQTQAGGPVRCYILAVAAGDDHFASIDTFGALSGERRLALELLLRMDGRTPGSETQWLGPDAARASVHEGRQRFRLAQAEQQEASQLEPVWKPILAQRRSSSASAEGERHTAAEYAFHSLPYRFQKYVEEYLAPDERILYAEHRRPLRSALRRALLRGKRLEEGVFIVSDQQVTEVVELMPPDSAGIRYGFIARSGVPERLEEVDVFSLSRDVVGLAVTWRAAHGSEEVIWEFPASRRLEVDQAAEVLRGWLARGHDRRLRRASPPAPPVELPPLRDPAANDPEYVKPLVARLEAELAGCVAPGEAVLARCLLPAWVEGRGAASLLAVTSRQLRIVPDPADPKAGSLSLSVPLQTIASLEFCSTLVQAYLRLFIPQPSLAKPIVHTIYFGKTLAAMNVCYLMLRRAMATTPIGMRIGLEERTT